MARHVLRLITRRNRENGNHHDWWFLAVAAIILMGAVATLAWVIVAALH
jgi:hypothetical protein